MHECSNQTIDQLSKQVFCLVLQIDVVFVVFSYAVLYLLVQLRDYFEAVLASVYHMDALQLLLLGQEQGRGRLIERFLRQLQLQQTDVVLENCFEAALQIEQSASSAELETPV